MALCRNVYLKLVITKGVFRHFPHTWNGFKTCTRLLTSHLGGAGKELPSPLAGIRVLDLSRILAGPFCTMLLGDLGAEIIKVEKPGSGDETRNWGPPFIGTESCYFISINRNKKSIAIDMKKEEGRNLIKELAKKSDVLIENYMPGKLKELGLGYEEINSIAPHLVYCSLTGYGSTGVYKNRGGYDVIAASLGGLLHITGPEDGDPCKVGVAMTDLSTGFYAHGAIMAALFQRHTTGKGQLIECNLLSTQVSLLVNIASNYLNAGTEAKRWGTAHESLVPYEAFKTSDGYLTVGAGSDQQFKILCKILDLNELAEDPKFKANHDRVKNRKELLSILRERFKTKATSKWLEEFEGSRIPYGHINNMKQVFEDPQVKHHNMVVEVKNSNGGNIYLVGPAVKYSESSNTVRQPPPLLGEHTDEVLSSILNLGHEEIAGLRSKNIVY